MIAHNEIHMPRAEVFARVIYGCPDIHDALWRIYRDDQEEAATEYNQEITGYSEGLKHILKYGGTAYHWLWHPAALTRDGWTCEQVP